jgi:hypothetical protein
LGKTAYTQQQLVDCIGNCFFGLAFGFRLMLVVAKYADRNQLVCFGRTVKPFSFGVPVWNSRVP